MQTKNRARILLGIFAVAVLGVGAGGLAGGLWRKSVRDPIYQNEGFLTLDGLDPKNAEKDLRRIHAALVTFRKLKGRLPKTPWELLDAGKAGLVDINEDDYRNPDVVKSPASPLDVKGKHWRKVGIGHSYGFEFATGGDDAWVSCSLYGREGVENGKDGKLRSVAEGFTMMLHADGRIVRRPVSEHRWVRDSSTSWRRFRHNEDPKGKILLTTEEMHEILIEQARKANNP